MDAGRFCETLEQGAGRTPKKGEDNATYSTGLRNIGLHLVQLISPL